MLFPAVIAAFPTYFTPYISSNSKKCSVGRHLEKPVFFGTRVPIKNLFDYLETGDSIETFLKDFDGVQKNQVVKVLQMSQKLIETSAHILNENFA